MVEVTEHVAAQVAIERLHPAVVRVELVHAHPVNHARSQRHGVGARDGDVVRKQLRAPDIGWPKVLQRIQRLIGERDDFLPGLDGRDNFRAV